jgi:hypothetical protein
LRTLAFGLERLAAAAVHGALDALGRRLKPYAPLFTGVAALWLLSRR